MDKRPLLDDILHFQKSRWVIGPVLIVVGIFGLILPILPGLLLILGGAFIVAPERVKRMFKRLLGPRKSEG